MFTLKGGVILLFAFCPFFFSLHVCVNEIGGMGRVNRDQVDVPLQSIFDNVYPPYIFGQVYLFASLFFGLAKPLI